MKLGVIGATGKTGRAVLKEAARRQLPATAIVRHPDRLREIVPTLERDLFQLTQADLLPFDAIICGFASADKPAYLKAYQHLATILTGTAVHLIVVGSGATLYTDQTKQHLVADQLPSSLRESSDWHLKAKAALTAADCDWTYVAPPYNYLSMAPRTGHYQVGSDILLHNRLHQSIISYADMAIALVDEAEHPQHLRQPMTVCWR
ncbi:MAG: NAD(P)H-binding protein [Lactobacillus sp.]|nr:NAD(P)H-binding protein [Lactobacillus sp.]MCI2034249.1 NAD(P)H-binding protein [Lactobacillus sp.]